MHLPQQGFYYHYKHDPKGSFENYAYEVIGVGFHTEMPHEDAIDPEEGMLVVYRPLYESAFVYRQGKLYDIRPLRMFMETVKKDGDTINRFTLIEDLEVISKLQAKSKELYS